MGQGVKTYSIEVYALNCLLLSRCDDDDDDDDDEISKRHLQWLPEPDSTSISTPQHQHWILRILMTDHASFPKFSNTFLWKKSRTSEVPAFREYLYEKYDGAKYDQLKVELDPHGVL